MDLYWSRASLGGLCLLAASLVLAVAAPSLSGAPQRPGGVVAGTVVDVGGRGIPGASVYVETDPGRLTENLTARTDAHGAFEIHGVPAGLVRVRVVHPSFTAAGMPEVEVDPLRDPVPVRIVLERGARVSGHVYLRDGRPFTSGWVIVTSSNPEYTYGWPEPIAVDESGAFVADHLAPGRGLVHVLALAPHAGPPAAASLKTLSPIAVEAVELRESEEAATDITLRDVIISGRVTRRGEAAAGVRVAVSSGPRRSVSFSDLPTAAAVTGPPPLETTTGEDGSYELLVFGPGPARVSFASASGEGFPARTVTVPDTDIVTLDFELAAAAVSGVVVDHDTGAPLPNVSLRLSRLDGRGDPGARGQSDADGAFAIAAEEGDYVLTAELLGRVRAVRKLTLGPDGLADERLEMGRGLSIVGRVVDHSGRPAPNLAVIAIGSDGFERAIVQSDGTFRLQGLGKGPLRAQCGLHPRGLRYPRTCDARTGADRFQPAARGKGRSAGGLLRRAARGGGSPPHPRRGRRPRRPAKLDRAADERRGLDRARLSGRGGHRLGERALGSRHGHGRRPLRGDGEAGDHALLAESSLSNETASRFSSKAVDQLVPQREELARHVLQVGVCGHLPQLLAKLAVLFCAESPTQQVVEDPFQVEPVANPVGDVFPAHRRGRGRDADLDGPRAREECATTRASGTRRWA